MNVLVADDDAASRLLLTTLLSKWGHTVVSATDGRTALEVLLDPGGPECALLDWQMPYMDGPDVCRAIRAAAVDGENRRRYRYIILVTGRQAAVDMVAGLQAGADDYLTKPIAHLEMHARLNTAQRILALQANLFATQEALRTQATRDGLTGSWNRAAGVALLERELARNRRDGRSTTVMLGDIDHFKNVNDTFGHSGGDIALVETCRRITTCLRREDLICRYGGEEFLLILPGLGHMHAAMVAERILRAVRGTPMDVGTDNKSTTVTISLGAHVAPGGHGEIREIIDSADHALYSSKTSGRDRYSFFPALEGTSPGLTPLHE